MSVLALSVLGLMGLAFMVDIGGSDPEDDSLDEGGPDDGVSLEEAPVAEAPVEGLQFVDQAIVAAEGGATLPDDVFENFTSANIGGEGADTLTGSDEGMELIVGNGGDDVLTGGLGDVLVGGEGDDTLNYDTGDSSGDFGYSGVSGDAGDDTLNLRHELGGSNFYDTAITSATGGEGADDFRIELVDGLNVDSEFEGYSDITSGDTA